MRSKVVRKPEQGVVVRTPPSASPETPQLGSWCEGGRRSGVRAVGAVGAACGALYAACWDSRAFTLLVCVLSLLAILAATRPDPPAARPCDVSGDLPADKTAAMQMVPARRLREAKSN